MLPVMDLLLEDPEPRTAVFRPCRLYSEDGLPSNFRVQYTLPTATTGWLVAFELPVTNPEAARYEEATLSHADGTHCLTVHYCGSEPQRLELHGLPGPHIDAHLAGVGADLQLRLGRFWQPLIELVQTGLERRLANPGTALTEGLCFIEPSHMFGLIIQLLPLGSGPAVASRVLQAWDTVLNGNMPEWRASRLGSRADHTPFQSEVVWPLRHAIGVANQRYARP